MLVLGLDLVSVCLFGFSIFVYFLLLLRLLCSRVFAFVELDLVSSVQEIGWEERLRNHLFCEKWDVKHYPSLLKSLLVVQLFL